MKIISTDSPSTVRPATTMPQSICARRAEPSDALTQNASYHLADCYLRGGDKQQRHAVVRHGFECRIRFRDCRRRAVQLWKIAIRTGGRTSSTKRFRYSTAMSPSIRRRNAPCTHGQRAVGRRPITIRTITTKRTRCISLLSRSRRRPACAAKQKIAYFRGLEALLEKRRYAGRRGALVWRSPPRIGISPKYNALATGFGRVKSPYGTGQLRRCSERRLRVLSEAGASKPSPNMRWRFYNYGVLPLRSKANMPRARDASFVRFIELYPTSGRLHGTDARNRLRPTRYYSDAPVRRRR